MWTFSWLVTTLSCSRPGPFAFLIGFSAPFTHYAQYGAAQGNYSLLEPMPAWLQRSYRECLSVNREFLAKDLGFDGVTPNSLDSVCDRDFVVEYLMWSTLLLTHFSQFAEDVIITNLLKGVDRKRRGQACQRKGCCRTEDRREEGHDTS